VANLKTRIATAKQTHVAVEQAAKEAEAAVAPLQVEAEKRRMAYRAAKNIADDKRALAKQVRANAEYEAAEKAAREAEVVLGPLRAAMQQADKAYADASSVATPNDNRPRIRRIWRARQAPKS